MNSLLKREQTLAFLFLDHSNVKTVNAFRNQNPCVVGKEASTIMEFESTTDSVEVAYQILIPVS